jgi:hypothetical protein
MRTLWDLENAFKNGGKKREFRFEVAGIGTYKLSIYEESKWGAMEWKASGEGKSLASAAEAALVEYRGRQK